MRLLRPLWMKATIEAKTSLSVAKMITKRRASSTRSKDRKVDRRIRERGSERLPKSRTFQRVLSSLTRRTPSDANGGAVLNNTSWNTSDDTVLATNRSSQQRLGKKDKGGRSKHIREGWMVVMESHAKSGKSSKSDACFFTFSDEDIKYQQAKERTRKKKSKRHPSFSVSQNQGNLIADPKKQEEMYPVNDKDENNENMNIPNMEKLLTKDAVFRDQFVKSNKVDKELDKNVPVATATINFMKFVACCSGMEDIPEASDQSITMTPEEI